MKDQIKKLLEPHYGHLEFLLKIKTHEVSLDDISFLIDLIKDKSLVSNLPKELHKYNSYYVLMKDLYFTKQNLFLIREIKNNLSSEPKRILLNHISDIDIQRKLNKIFKDEKLKSVFLRWSSRMDENFVHDYINSVINDYKVWDEIGNEKSTLIELKDFGLHSKYIPSSWCIKKESTFYSYLRTQRIFIFKYKCGVYGVNVDRRYADLNRIPFITIQDSENHSVLSNNTELYNAAKTELMRFNLFGSNEKESGCKIGNQKGIFRRIKDFFTRSRRNNANRPRWNPLPDQQPM